MLHPLHVVLFVGVAYLGLTVLVELLLFDLPALCGDAGKVDAAVNFYKFRKNNILYKIVPLFCLLTIVGVISNIVLRHKVEDGLASAIVMIVMSILIVCSNTALIINPVASLVVNSNMNMEEEAPVSEDAQQEEDKETDLDLKQVLRKITCGHIVVVVTTTAIICMTLWPF